MSDISQTHKAALAYAAKGIAVFPCIEWDAPGRGPKEQGKAPATEHGLKDATVDVAQINAWWTAHPNWNVGIATGEPATFWVLDVDGPEGAASLAAMEEKHGSLPPTPEQTTARGRHICFAYDVARPIRNSASRHPRHGADPRKNIDVRGDGGYIVAAPSKHQTGITYTWHPERRPSKMAFATAPEWLREIVEWKPVKLAAQPAAPSTMPPRSTTMRPQSAGKLITPYGESALRDECKKIETSTPGNQETTLNTSAFVIGQLVGGGEINESMARAALVQSGMVIARDWTVVDVSEKVERALSAGMNSPRSAPERPDRSSRPDAPITQSRPTSQEQPDEAPKKIVNISDGRGYTDDTAWEREIIRKDDAGTVHPKRVKNAILFLSHHPLMRGVLAFDEFARRVVVAKRPPWDPDDGTDWETRGLRDNDVVLATAWLETRGIVLNSPTIHGACTAAAIEHPFNPAIDWLDGLKWDQEQRLDKWLTYYLGAEDTAYTRAVGRKWWIGAVARVMRPGCKMDTMLILEGAQGIRKSGAARIIGTFGGTSYFTDEIDDIGSKDAAMQLSGVSIVEIPEMNTFERSDINAIKAWLTRTTDRYRPPYGRSVIEAPRQCVLIGTMNPDGTGYLHDATGARRFWPVAVEKCDTDALAADQPQLWAEALAAFREGADWWLDDDEAAPAREAQSERYAEDAWSAPIDEYIGLMTEVRIESICGDSCLKIPTERLTSAIHRRVAKHLKRRGWQRKKAYDPQTHSTKWSFVKPPEDRLL